MRGLKTGKCDVIELYMGAFGFFSTMPLIQIASMTTYVWFLMFFAVILLIYAITHSLHLKIHNIEKIYVLVFLSVTVSMMYSMTSMPAVWKVGNVSSWLQLFVAFVFYLFFVTTEHDRWLYAFVRGVYAAAVFQMIWGYLQLFLDMFRIDLNNLIFRDWLEIVEESATQTKGGSIKVSGMCWNAGNLAPLLIFGYVYSRNPILKILFVILSLVSGSRTAMLGIVFCLFLQFVGSLRKNRMSKKIFFLISVIAILIGGIAITNHNIINVFWIRFKDSIMTLNRLSLEGSGSVHLRYITSVLAVTRRNSLVHNLIGFGIGCSGYVFANYYSQYVESGKWVVECDYINYLWNYGYVGFVLYYLWYIRNVLRSIHIDYRYFLLFASFLFEGIFYNITFNWVTLLIISIFILSLKGINIFEVRTKK